MKKTILLTVLLFVTVQFTFAQNTIAKLKFEEAEEAYANNNFELTLTKLNEVETILKATNPKILYLQILAQNQIISLKNPYDDYTLLKSVKKNCALYLTKYESIDNNEDRYKEVYLISEYLKNYSINENFLSARAYYYGNNGVSKDSVKAKTFCEKAILEGDPMALNLMGSLYKKKKDFQKAMEYYQKSADMGCSFGLYNLGREYSSGEYLSKDTVKALGLFKAAANKGLPVAMSQLASIYYIMKDYGKAFDWYKKAADKGDASAMFRIAMMYDFGRGVEQNYNEAMNWYKKVADKGVVNAMFNVGVKYYNGEGATQNYTEAMNWYIKAADKGVERAMYSVGEMYYNGTGVAENYTEAMNWFKKAADEGNANAMYYIGEIYYSGKGVTLDYTEAMNWYIKAADMNDASAMKKIGSMYAQGLGVKKDKNIAKNWDDKAAVAETKK